MARLILLLVFIAVLAATLASTMVVLRSISAQTAQSRGTMTMPKTFHTIAYALLIVLMMGVASGWIGGL